VYIIRDGRKLRPEAQAAEDQFIAAGREASLRQHLKSNREALSLVRVQIQQAGYVDPVDVPERNPRDSSRLVNPNARLERLFDREKKILAAIEELEFQLGELEADCERANAARLAAEEEAAERAEFERAEVVDRAARFEAWRKERRSPDPQSVVPTR
jgi:hypothetical protein